ncbi:MAG: LLM class flavin-dependent oxidoreductase [Shimia sp.]|nr:LLM class flavin-dependent oxidoreductase [Shimia sp.]
MIPYSLLDLAPIPAGKTAGDSLRNTLDLAQHAERWGYTRYWLAEHHNFSGIASSATAVLIGQVLAATRSMRVGSGGIMLPNHAPLVVAEQFGTLATLYPDRVDLGLGRAPGTDMNTMRALRRGMSGADRFPDEVVELIGFLQESQEDQPVRAVPGEGTNVPVWLLGSSLFGAQLAGQLGLPYAFASHFASDALEEALALYRHRFQPGITQAPHFMLAINIFAADTDEEAARLRTSSQQGFINLRKGTPGPLPAPVDNILSVASEAEVRAVNHALRVTALGNRESVCADLELLMARYQPDEVIFTSMIHDHDARLRSFEIAAEVMRDAS